MTLNPAKDPSCVLAFDWGEGAGNVLYDLSQYGNNGTIYGAVRTRGILRFAGSLDGVDDYVEVPDSPSLDITDEITMIAWIKAVEYPSLRQYILNKEYSYRFFINSAGRITFQLNLDGNWAGNWVISNSVMALNKWAMIATTYSAETEQAIIYINGNKDASGNPAGVYITPSNYSFWIGHAVEAGTWFKGLIGSPRIYNRALTEKELLEHYYYGIKMLSQKIPSKYVPSPLRV